MLASLQRAGTNNTQRWDAGRSADSHDEVLEVFSEEGCLIGSAPRRQVHKDGLLHRAVYCFVFNQNGDLLVQRRSFKYASRCLNSKHLNVCCLVGTLALFDPFLKNLKQLCSKKIGPGLWDISVAEHLNPGETFDSAALRGLQEELGIHARAVEGPLAATHRRSLKVRLRGGLNVVPGQGMFVT